MRGGQTNWHDQTRERDRNQSHLSRSCTRLGPALGEDNGIRFLSKIHIRLSVHPSLPGPFKEPAPDALNAIAGSSAYGCLMGGRPAIAAATIATCAIGPIQ
jgi:hypothetical protein